MEQGKRCEAFYTQFKNNHNEVATHAEGDDASRTIVDKRQVNKNNGKPHLKWQSVLLMTRRARCA